MSLLADIFLAHNDEDALRYNSEPASFGDREQYTGFTVLELSTLWAVMQSVEWDEHILDEFATVFQESGVGHWVHLIPAAMSLELTRMTPEQLTLAAAKWASTDEMACEPSDVLPIVEGLIRLAKKGRATDQSIYFRGSL